MAVSSLSLESVQSLDAGKWVNSKFAGTRVPTLREALEFTKGKVGINLDLKLSVNQSFVIPDLIALIDEFDMQYQVLLTSTCLTCLVMAKELNPNIQTGYITYQITPALLANSYIDVISMKSSFVTQSIVRQVHNANKKILVWTVNTRSEIERMSHLGVDNIITDRPFYAKEVIFKLKGDRFIVTIFKIILNS
jgi:glycerophosphoryl diester phosphodiesterase